MSFFAELRRRNVIRMAGLYLVGAWIIVQVAETLLPAFEVPAWVLRAIVIVLALGFFPALIFAWIFELTPEGLKRDHEVDRAQSIAPQTGQRMNVILAILLALVLVYFAVDRFVISPTQGALDVAASLHSGRSSAGVSTAITQPRSIAVLPFENLSADRNNEYFADGVAEELLNQLAQLPGLKVAGRTSSFAFKDHDEDMREIGRKLGVAYLVEGSIRRSQDRVRITAQLVKAADGFHVWSQTYDRELTDIFAVQDEISAAITAALKLNLLGAAGPAVPKVSVEAYDAYLRGLSLMALRGSGNLRAARDRFKEALAIEPDYVAAMVSLARTNLLLPFYDQLAPAVKDELAGEAQTLARRALVLDAANAGAHLVLGTLLSEFDWRWDEAGVEIERALQLAPGSAEVANFAGDYFVEVRDPNRAIATEQRAAELDPQAPFSHWDLALAYLLVNDDPQRAIESALVARRIEPQSLKPLKLLVWCHARLGQFAEMNQALEAARAVVAEPEFERLALEAYAAIAEDRRESAKGILMRMQELVESGNGSPATLGYDYLLVDEPEQARQWLQVAYRQRDPAFISQLQPLDLERIAAEPLTRGILDQPGLRELREIRRRNARADTP